MDDPTKIFYNVDSKIWLTSSMEYDMSFIERKSWELPDAKTEEEFGNFRGRKVIRTKAAWFCTDEAKGLLWKQASHFM